MKGGCVWKIIHAGILLNWLWFRLWGYGLFVKLSRGQWSGKNTFASVSCIIFDEISLDKWEPECLHFSLTPCVFSWWLRQFISLGSASHTPKGIVLPNWFSPISLCRRRLWWHFLIHVSILEVHGQEFHWRDGYASHVIQYKRNNITITCIHTSRVVSSNCQSDLTWNYDITRSKYPP